MRSRRAQYWLNKKTTVVPSPHKHSLQTHNIGFFILEHQILTFFWTLSKILIFHSGKLILMCWSFEDGTLSLVGAKKTKTEAPMHYYFQDYLNIHLKVTTVNFFFEHSFTNLLTSKLRILHMRWMLKILTILWCCNDQKVTSHLWF